MIQEQHCICTTDGKQAAGPGSVQHERTRNETGKGKEGQRRGCGEDEASTALYSSSVQQGHGEERRARVSEVSNNRSRRCTANEGVINRV